MSDKSQRTEKPTPQRLRKAREEGQFPQAKEFVAAVQFAVAVGLLGSVAAGWLERAENDMRASIARAFGPSLDAADAVDLARRFLISGFAPLASAAGVLLGATLLTQLASTNLGVSFARLAPSFKRFNPLGRLREFPRQNLPSAIQAVILIGVMAYLLHSIVTEHLAMFLRLAVMDIRSGVGLAAASVQRLLWQMAAVLMAFGAIEFLRHRWLYHGDMAMTKQEIREEHKSQEGDPHIKARVRRLRRDLLRRQMMREVPKATAVVVNPTHFAVAIRYDMQSMASPVVVAKGRNWLALRIRQIATENGVAIVENPPLARALYEAVEVGREIPPDFYRAVAEVLAYVFKLTGMRRN